MPQRTSLVNSEYLFLDSCKKLIVSLKSRKLRVVSLYLLGALEQETGLACLYHHVASRRSFVLGRWGRYRGAQFESLAANPPQALEAEVELQIYHVVVVLAVCKGTIVYTCILSMELQVLGEEIVQTNLKLIQ